jgi:two-component system LytT family sensor kinase
MKLKDLTKIEFWLATGWYAFAILMLISNPDGHMLNQLRNTADAGNTPSYLSSYLIPELFRFSIIYFSFLLLNFCVLPALFKTKDRTLALVILLCLFLVIGLITSVSYTYSMEYMFARFGTLKDAYNYFFLKGFSYAAWLILIICIYTGLKKLIIYFNDQDSRQYDPNNRMKLEAVFGGAFWFVGLLLLIATSSAFGVMLCWTLVICSTICIIIFSIYYLIPQVKREGKTFRSYFWKIFLIAIVSCVPLVLIALLFNNHSGMAAAVIAFHIPTQLLISTTLSWYIYKKRSASNAELTSLKTELGRSDANLSFLRSQINPHFLFNALNTLYGTALQEKAERTGEGIQKLGDMMRFMLQENLQDKIPLTRDIDYLNNYIALQKLRTSRSPSIVIEAQIEEQLNYHLIAPMLLIPFVENAFKHGISLQEPSHLKITLQTKENTLYFDVNNTIHLKNDNDPEKLQSGIGLQNVKRRLALLYPNQHELIIRESAKEFFIHLTLQLQRIS